MRVVDGQRLEGSAKGVRDRMSQRGIRRHDVADERQRMRTSAQSSLTAYGHDSRFHVDDPVPATAILRARAAVVDLVGMEYDTPARACWA
jgi:hypothetical protein